MQWNIRIDPRECLFWAPALLLPLLLLLLFSLESWSGRMEGRADALRRQLQTVQAEKTTLLSFQATRAEALARSGGQKAQGVNYAILENTLRASGLGDFMRQLRPEVRDTQDSYVEERLSLRLTQLEPPHVLRFFYETEKALPGIMVEEMSLRRNSSGFMDIDAVFVARMAK